VTTTTRHLDLDFAQDSAVREEPSSDEKGAEGHKTSDNSEEERPNCGDEVDPEEDASD
jgi:hypothetical protein